MDTEAEEAARRKLVESFLGRKIAGRYVLNKILGQGGMGTLFAAHDESLGTGCAIKILHACNLDNSDAVKRFIDEARAVAHIRSPYVVRVIDQGRYREKKSPGRDAIDILYIAMELLQGSDLFSFLRAGQRFSLRDILRILEDVLQGLRAAHLAGIIHRDIKPENIFLARTPEGTLAMLIDFGIAKLPEGIRSRKPTETGVFFGTAQYMPPEQIRDSGQVDMGADLYALGIVASELITGTLFYDTASVAELIVKLLNEPFPRRPWSIPPDADPDFAQRIWDELILPAVQQETTRRFRSSQAMLDVVRSLLADLDPQSIDRRKTLIQTPLPPAGADSTILPIKDGHGVHATMTPQVMRTTQPEGRPARAYGRARRALIVLAACAASLGLLVLVGRPTARVPSVPVHHPAARPLVVVAPQPRPAITPPPILPAPTTPPLTPPSVTAPAASTAPAPHPRRPNRPHPQPRCVPVLDEHGLIHPCLR